MNRTRIATATALVSLGIAVAAVSCTNPPSTKGEAPSKTTGPAIAKGDKTTAAPGRTPAKPAATAETTKPVRPAGTTPAKPVAANDGPVAPPRPGAPLPPPLKPKKVTGETPAKPPVKPTASTPPTPAKPPVKPTPAKPPVKPTASTPPTPAKPPVKPTPAKPPVKPTASTPPTPAKPPVKPTASKPPVPTKPAKPTATKPAAAKPTPAKPVSEADAILAKRQAELRLLRQKNAILVEDYIEKARASAAAYDWEDTAAWASKALEKDHNNDEAESLLRQARAAQGYRDAEIAGLSELLSQTASVKAEQARFEANRHWQLAMEAKEAGNYGAALEHLGKAKTVVENDPAGVNWGSLDDKIEAEITAVSELKVDADKAARRDAAAEAYRRAKQEEAGIRLAEAERIEALRVAASEAFQEERFAQAEKLLRQYLEAKPDDTNAKLLLSAANRGKHERMSARTLERHKEQVRLWRLDMKETTVPYHRILTWPSREHWNRITELRKDAGVVEASAEDSPETEATRNRLRSERITFSYDDAEFATVIGFIRSAKQLNIVVNPEVAPELEAIPISLSLQDVSVEQALDTLTKVAGDLIYVVQGSLVEITRPEFARADPIVQVHAVGDLTVALTNFIAPNLQLLPAGAEEDEDNPRYGGASEGVTPFGGVEELVTLITTNVANEDYWSEDGVSIDPAGSDKLVVVAEPEVQRQVVQFLNDLRGFAGIVVTIETRFLTVTDNFLRDVGVDIRGLGGNNPGPLAVLDDLTNGLVNNASAGFDNSGIGLPANASGRPSSGAFFNNGSDGDYRARTENVFDRALGTAVTNVGGAMLQYTLVDDTSLSFIMQAVEKRQQGRVLQAPSVTVYNTQRANITLINQLTFIQDFDVEVAQTAFIADPIVGVIQDGLVLDVQPTVSHDRKYITVQLKPTVATLVRPIPTFTTSLGAFTNPVTIQIPELRVQQAGTTVRIPDGGTLLMGGLKNISLKDLRSETPWFSSIPFASFFFGRKGSSQEQSNLLVIVKATISDLQEQEPTLGYR